MDAPPAATAKGAVEARILGLVGLGVRSRRVVVGVEMVRAAAKKGTLVLAIVAPDASRHSRDKVLPLLAAKGVQVIEGPTAAALGAAAGRESTAAVGVIDRDLAKGISEIAELG